MSARPRPARDEDRPAPPVTVDRSVGWPAQLPPALVRKLAAGFDPEQDESPD